MEYYVSALKKYAVFEGRATRSEFWYFVLFNILISSGIGFVSGILAIIYVLAVFIPGLSLTVRRLHDSGKSGWWILITLIPVIGALVLIIFTVADSQIGANAYGPNPKEDSNPDVSTPPVTPAE